MRLETACAGNFVVVVVKLKVAVEDTFLTLCCGMCTVYWLCCVYVHMVVVVTDTSALLCPAEITTVIGLADRKGRLPPGCFLAFGFHDPTYSSSAHALRIFYVVKVPKIATLSCGWYDYKHLDFGSRCL